MIELYHSQRAMRNMRRAALQRGVVAILDVGSSKISCLVLRFDGGAALEADGIGSLAGQVGFRVIGAATTRSRGVRFGEIHAMQETERAIRTALQAAQKMANIRVDHVIASFSGAEPRSYGLAGAVDVEGHVVTEQDRQHQARDPRQNTGPVLDQHAEGVRPHSPTSPVWLELASLVQILTAPHPPSRAPGLWRS